MNIPTRNLTVINLYINDKTISFCLLFLSRTKVMTDIAKISQILCNNKNNKIKWKYLLNESLVI